MPDDEPFLPCGGATMPAGPKRSIRAIEAHLEHFDQHFVRAGFGSRKREHADAFAAAWLDRERSHGGHVSQSIGRFHGSGRTGNG